MIARRVLPALLAAGCGPLRLLDALEPRGARRETGIAYGPLPRQRLDVYRPATPGPHPVCVFLYGGGWTSGERTNYRFVGQALTSRGIIAVIPDYRLSPEFAFPAFVEDCAAATAWALALAHAPALGGGRVFLSGHSAGAYNAAMVALDPSFLAAAGASRDALAGLVALAGPYEFDPAREHLAAVFGNPSRQSMPARLPLAGAPRTLLLAGDADDTVRPHNSTDLAAKLRTAGIDANATLYPGIGHIGILLALSDTFRGRAPVLEDLARFMT